ncbi:Cyclic nucleotide-gated cation channel like protein [Argiope bruennichi]|uniref:Cyclic nucleotide-gated cation channel like protein n=1 Tax=Argiope bruennichi TaxID=94029 RepID=A0A8T0FUN3_ARGBR|nr:Cyclic nucleotide-gated cation channel like protein [Argiope bruennichi]
MIKEIENTGEKSKLAESVECGGGVMMVDSSHSTINPPPHQGVSTQQQALQITKSPITTTAPTSVLSSSPPADSSVTVASTSTAPKPAEETSVTTSGRSRWLKLRTTVQLSSAITQVSKKPPLKREDSFLKRFSTRPVPDQNSAEGSSRLAGEGIMKSHFLGVWRSVVNPDENILFYWLSLLTICLLYNAWTIIVRQAFPVLPVGPTSVVLLDASQTFLKLYRSFRLYYMVESRTIYPNLWRVVNLIHILLLLAHWFGCFYYLLSELEDFVGEWSYRKPVDDYATLSRKYLGSVYWSTLTLTTIGDLATPATNLQYMFTIVSYLIGVFIFATIVGQVGTVITNRNASRLEFERLLDGAKLYMRHHKVPRNMQRRVQRWYDYSWSRGRMQGGGDINSALGILPDKLKTELALHVNLKTLKKVSIFQECQPEFLHDLVLKMRAYIFTPGDLICRKGEVAREMFIIADGILEVISETGKVLTQMKAGDFFGEIGILNLDGFNRRTADVRSVGYSELFSLSREDILAAMKDYPEAQDILQTMGRKRLMEARLAATINRTGNPNEPILPTSLQEQAELSESPKARSTVTKLKDVRSLKNLLRTRSTATGNESDSAETIELKPLTTSETENLTVRSDGSFTIPGKSWPTQVSIRRKLEPKSMSLDDETQDPTAEEQEELWRLEFPPPPPDMEEAPWLNVSKPIFPVVAESLIDTVNPSEEDLQEINKDTQKNTNDWEVQMLVQQFEENVLLQSGSNSRRHSSGEALTWDKVLRMRNTVQTKNQTSELGDPRSGRKYSLIEESSSKTIGAVREWAAAGMSSNVPHSSSYTSLINPENRQGTIMTEKNDKTDYVAPPEKNVGLFHQIPPKTRKGSLPTIPTASTICKARCVSMEDVKTHKSRECHHEASVSSSCSQETVVEMEIKSSTSEDIHNYDKIKLGTRSPSSPNVATDKESHVALDFSRLSDWPSSPCLPTIREDDQTSGTANTPLKTSPGRSVSHDCLPKKGSLPIGKHSYRATSRPQGNPDSFHSLETICDTSGQTMQRDCVVLNLDSRSHHYQEVTPDNQYYSHVRAANVPSRPPLSSGMPLKDNSRSISQGSVVIAIPECDPVLSP